MLVLPWGSLSRSLGASLVFPYFNSLYYSACFDGGSAQSILVICGNAFLAFPIISLARLLSLSLVAPWRTHLIEYIIVLIKAPV